MSADIYLSATDCCSAHNHNITHNLAPMFRMAGVDWRDYVDGERTARELLGEIVVALRHMATLPEQFREMNPPNGWGNYEGAVAFLARLAADCLRHPEAIIEVSL